MDELKQGIRHDASRVMMWLTAAFMVPPVVWLGAGTYLNIWSPQELLRIMLSPFIWLYILIFVGGTILLIRHQIKKIVVVLSYEKPKKDQVFTGIRAVNKVPLLFFLLMSIYCVAGPNAALLGQTVSVSPFLDRFEYLLAQLLGIPLILLFTIPFFILMVKALERFSFRLDVSGKHRFLSLRHKLIISFLLNIIGSLLTLLIAGLAILYKEDGGNLFQIFSRKFVITGSVVLLLSAINLILIDGQITKPVQELTIGLSKVFTVFSKGEGRLETGVNISSRDELGYISRRFNTFIQALNRIFTKFRIWRSPVMNARLPLKNSAGKPETPWFMPRKAAVRS